MIHRENKMSIADDFRRIMNGGEPPEDSLQYTEVDPLVLGDLVSKCYIVTSVSHRKYLELVLRNLQDQTFFYCLHIFNPAFIEMTAWKAGDDGAKYVIDVSKM